MATDSNSKLTKFENATTVVTSEFANSIFGGLYGSSEGDLLDADDPQVVGHIHDGTTGDGHCGYIHLQDHVTSKLLHENLADEAVRVNNVWASLDPIESIPEYEIRSDGKAWYYLDLSHIRNDFTFKQVGYAPTDPDIPTFPPYDPADDTDLNPDPTISSDAKPLIRHGDEDYSSGGFDFVFGSASLDDMAGMNHPDPFTGIVTDGLGDNRFFFDRSKGAFRAGTCESSHWDNGNRGINSVAFGLNNTSSGDYSSALGGSENLATGEYSSVLSGYSNKSTDDHAVVLGGESNESGNIAASVSGGRENTSSGVCSSVSGGELNKALFDYSNVSGGYDNKAQGSYSAVLSGNGNTVDSSASCIAGGESSSIGSSSNHSVLSGGIDNSIVSSEKSFVGGGANNKIDTSNHSVVLGGGGAVAVDGNTVTNSSFSSVVGGSKNSISNYSDYSVVAGGWENSLDDNSYCAVISGGRKNKVRDSSAATPSSYSVISGGFDNEIDESEYSVISGGFDNEIYSKNSTISGGVSNSISASSSEASYIGSGHGNSIGGMSSYSVICGGGEYDSTSGLNGNLISGSSISFIGGGSSNVINATSHHSVIVGGISNSVDGSTGSMVISGSNNSIASSPNSFIYSGHDNSLNAVESCGINSGQLNSMNGVDPTLTTLLTVPLRGPTGRPGFSTILSGDTNTIEECTHSIISSGFENSITNGSSCSLIGSGSSNTIDNGCTYSQIHGGAYNEIMQTCEASSVISGYGNRMVGSTASVILGGKNNKIMNTACSSAFGSSSFSYSWGQSSIASSKFDIAGMASAGSYDVGTGSKNWSVLGDDNAGNSQSFSLMMSGHWSYNSATLEAFLDGSSTLSPNNVFISFLDGATGFAHRWMPRDNCSYTYTIDATLNFTEEKPAAKSVNHCISFSIKGGLICRPDSSIVYRNNNISVITNFATASGVGIPDGMAGLVHDFGIFFTHDFTNPTNNSSAAGPWVAPTVGAGFGIVVVNNGDATGNKYVGESLVAKLNIVETSLQAYKDNTP